MNIIKYNIEATKIEAIKATSYIKFMAKSTKPHNIIIFFLEKIRPDAISTRGVLTKSKPEKTKCKKMAKSAKKHVDIN